MIDTALIAEKLKEFGYQQRYLERKIGWLMSFDRDIRQWKCGKVGVVNLQKVSSIVRDIGEPCLHQSSIKVVITINKMLKPDKWQATFDGDGKVSGFQKVLKLIILGIFLALVYLRLGTKQQSKTCDGGCCSHQDGLVAFQGFATASESCGTVSVYVNQAVFSSDDCVEQFAPANNSFENGVDPSIRPEVWEFLLGCYALSSTAEYRRQLRTARRERYTELIKQCQTMHSSIGTGSLAYVVGSKVMDMRTSSKDEGKREAEVQSRQASDVDTNKPDSYTNGNNNCTDTSHAYKRESSSDSGDLLSVRGSLIGAAYDSSCFLPASHISVHYKCSSPNPVEETFGSNFQAENYFDFPPLPVTDLFEKRKKDKKGCRSFDGGLSTRRRLRFGDEHMHSFRISNNADLVVESNHSAPDDILRCSNSESDVCWDGHNPVSWSENLVYETEMLNKLRISDAPETPPINAATSQGGNVSEDRVSEWLWTLHRIVVDVVRTDSHLEFYEDTKNLARMSDILAVYAWVDPRTGYCQGMSDLLSPFVVLFEDNADAFWCFEMLLRRMRENFQMEGPTGVMKQLQGLWHILELTDKEMFSHLSLIGAESLHFAFRMLLVLFRRELSFNEALSMWEMMWAADFDESLSCHLDDNCPELLVIQIPRDSRAEMEQESIDNSPSCLKGGASSKKGHLEHSVSDNTGIKSASAHPFCGLAKTFWSRNDRLHVGTALSTMGNGDDELPVFCVAAILIMNRQKIIRETHSIDDLIKIFNDNLLKIRVKRCIRTAIKLRKKYFYKLIKSRSPAAQSVD